MQTKQYILSTLAYFDIFHYPLLKEELFNFHGQLIQPEAMDAVLTMLLEEHRIFKLGEFYSLHNDNELAANRKKGNRLAELQMKTAHKAAKILSRFPYVKGLAISGSLSKNYSTEESDIDFFIITKENRLWIARTLMHFYKKLSFLTGKEKWFCMNYYVDEAGLKIEEKNIYTAIEVVTLLPMQGKTAMRQFSDSNEWSKTYLPCYKYIVDNVPEIKRGFGKRAIEKLFSGSIGNGLDNWLMSITNKRWQKKVVQRRKNEKGLPMGMLVDKHFSKPDPKFFQQKVLQQYENKIGQLTEQLTEKQVPVTPAVSSLK